MQVFDLYQNFQEMSQKVPMDEKFSEPNDVTMAIPKCLEDVDKLADETWQLYLDYARNRNLALVPISEKLMAMKVVIEQCLGFLEAGGEEDANTNLDVPTVVSQEDEVPKEIAVPEVATEEEKPKDEPNDASIIEAIEAFKDVLFEPTNKGIPVYFKSTSTGFVMPAKGDWDSKSGIFSFTDDAELNDFKKYFSGKAKELKLQIMGFEYDYMKSRVRPEGAVYQYLAFIQVDLTSKKRPPADQRII